MALCTCFAYIITWSLLVRETWPHLLHTSLEHFRALQPPIVFAGKTCWTRERRLGTQPTQQLPSDVEKLRILQKSTLGGILLHGTARNRYEMLRASFFSRRSQAWVATARQWRAEPLSSFRIALLPVQQ